MKRILSIDGGGIKGVFPAAFLASIEQNLGRSVTRHFDLIAGTSTGGIIALGLGLGLSASDILGFYEQHGPTIFYGNKWLNKAKQVVGAKYSNNALKNALETTFQDKRLGESSTRLVIPAMNPIDGQVHIFKTAHHEHLREDYKCLAVDVALGTSAAPTFFPVHTTEGGVPLLDGGLWANNPVGFAVVEAIGMLKWPAEEISVLSIGCTSEPLDLIWGKRSPGLVYWARKIIETFMVSQSSASSGVAYTLLSHEQVQRFSPVVSRGMFKLDSVKAIPKLKALGNSEGRKAIQFLTHFFNTDAEPFVPVWNN